MPEPAVLDHIVVNARTGMDLCESQFRDLGFALTPRGYHTLGSINALAIFQTDYLELLGLPPGKEDLRPELSGARPGLNGVVFKTANADETHAHLVSLGIDAVPPKSFSRPVTLEDGTSKDVKFRTVTVPSDVFPAGRLYFCEHLTPDLVWRREWQRHANGARKFLELVVLSEKPDSLGARVGEILRIPPKAGGDDATVHLRHAGFTLTIQTPDAYRKRFGTLAVSGNERTDAIGAVVVSATLGEGLRRDLEARPDDFEIAELAEGVGIKVRAFETLVVFSGG